jgi:hypothetical protein
MDNYQINLGDLVRFDFSDISNEIFKKYLAPVASNEVSEETEWCEINQGEVGIVVGVYEGLVHVLFNKYNKVLKINKRRIFPVRVD